MHAPGAGELPLRPAPGATRSHHYIAVLTGITLSRHARLGSADRLSTRREPAKRLGIPILKKQRMADGSLVVAGPCTDDTLDRDGQIVDSDFAKRALKEWYDELGAPVRNMHSGSYPPAGKGISLDLDGGKPWIRAKIVEPTAIKLIEEGIYKDFSVGIFDPEVKEDKKAPGGRIVDGWIGEVSLVDIGSNKNAHFTLAKRAQRHARSRLTGVASATSTPRRTRRMTTTEPDAAGAQANLAKAIAAATQAGDIAGAAVGAAVQTALLKGGGDDDVNDAIGDLGGDLDNVGDDFGDLVDAQAADVAGDDDGDKDGDSMSDLADTLDKSADESVPVGKTKACKTCAGSGKVLDADCARCGGKGIRLKKGKQKIKIKFDDDEKQGGDGGDSSDDGGKSAKPKATKGRKAVTDGDGGGVCPKCGAKGMFGAKCSKCGGSMKGRKVKATKAKATKGKKVKSPKGKGRLKPVASPDLPDKPGPDAPPAGNNLKSVMDPEVVRAHDALCPAWSMQTVKASYPTITGLAPVDIVNPTYWASQLKSLTDGSMKVSDAGIGAAYQMYAAAHKLASLNSPTFEQMRDAANKSFMDAYPTVSLKPGLISPDQFNRGFLPSANPMSSDTTHVPNPDLKDSLDAGQFQRGALTDNETRASLVGGDSVTGYGKSKKAKATKRAKANKDGGGVATSPTPSRLFYRNSDKDSSASAMALMHDYIVQNHPGICPMHAVIPGDPQIDSDGRIGQPAEMNALHPTAAALTIPDGKGQMTPTKAAEADRGPVKGQIDRRAVRKMLAKRDRRWKRRESKLKSKLASQKQELAKPSTRDAANRGRNAFRPRTDPQHTLKVAEAKRHTEELRTRLHDPNSTVSTRALDALQAEGMSDKQIAALLTADI